MLTLFVSESIDDAVREVALRLDERRGTAPLVVTTSPVDDIDWVESLVAEHLLPHLSTGADVWLIAGSSWAVTHLLNPQNEDFVAPHDVEVAFCDPRAPARAWTESERAAFWSRLNSAWADDDWDDATIPILQSIMAGLDHCPMTTLGAYKRRTQEGA